MKVIFDVMGVFLAFYTSIDKVKKCIALFQSQSLIDFGLIPKNIWNGWLFLPEIIFSNIHVFGSQAA